jgi:CubicO group peptidase (beta-lactamase class C family)
MTTLDRIIADGVARNVAPGFVAMTGNRAGVTWAGCAGERAPGMEMSLDSVFRLFSMTKAIGSVAAMILVERGELSMDTPVADILPEAGRLPLLTGFDGETPCYATPRTPITVRHLATHTSGLAYDNWAPLLSRWRKATGQPTGISGLKEALNCPLMFEPGSRWGYGIGTDWLGHVVETVDGRRIDQFCIEEILEPLEMTDTVFELAPGMAQRMCAVHARGGDGAFVTIELSPPSQPEIYGMGYALYATAPDYMRFLRMIMNDGALDGHRILSPDSVKTMLANQIGPLRIDRMVTTSPMFSADVDFFPGTPKTHGFACMRVEEDVPGMRSAGSQGWAGLFNTHYWFDPAKDVIGLLMTQTLPFVEPAFVDLYTLFERATYAALAEA